jgi:hypothetical protein
MSAQDKYTLEVPNGLAFSEFGYESRVVAPPVDATCLRQSWQSGDDRRLSDWHLLATALSLMAPSLRKSIEPEMMETPPQRWCQEPSMTWISW